MTLTVQLGRRLLVSRVISRVGVGTSRVGIGTSRVGVVPSRGVGVGQVVGSAGGAGEAAALAGRQVEEAGGGGGGGLEGRGEDAAGSAATERSVVDSRRRCNDTKTARSVSAGATQHGTAMRVDRLLTLTYISSLQLRVHRLPVLEVPTICFVA